MATGKWFWLEGLVLVAWSVLFPGPGPGVEDAPVRTLSPPVSLPPACLHEGCLRPVSGRLGVVCSVRIPTARCWELLWAGVREDVLPQRLVTR